MQHQAEKKDELIAPEVGFRKDVKIVASVLDVDKKRTNQGLKIEIKIPNK